MNIHSSQDLIIKKTKKGDICKLDQMDPNQKTEVVEIVFSIVYDISL